MTVLKSGARPEEDWQDPALAPQRSPLWHEARLGCVTASRIADVTARTKSGYGAARLAYMRQLLSERLTGMPTEIYANSAMRWGTDMEPHAVVAYEDLAGIETEPVGFLTHPTLAFAGASPDRLVGDRGLLEVKCPQTSTHVDTLLSGEVAEKYILQMQWQMACSGREWCDFVSFDPRLPPAYALYSKRVERDDKLIAWLEGEVMTFLAEVDEKLHALALSRASGFAMPAL